MAHEWAYCQRCGHAHPRHKRCDAWSGRELLAASALVFAGLFVLWSCVLGLDMCLDLMMWR